MALLWPISPAGASLAQAAWSDALPTLGPAAVMVGQFIWVAQRLCEEGRAARSWRWAAWGQAGLMAAASVALPLLIGLQRELFARGRWPDDRLWFASMTWWY